MLEILKDLLNINDNSKDVVLGHYLSKSKKSIQSHLNYKDEEFTLIQNKFETQIVDLAEFYYKNRKVKGVVQQSQGSRSQSMERGIPKEIIDSLPLPRVRIVGGR